LSVGPLSKVVSLADIKTSQKNDELWFNFINNFPEDTIIFALVTLKSIYLMYRSEDKFLSRFVRLAGGYLKKHSLSSLFVCRWLPPIACLFSSAWQQLLVFPRFANGCFFSRTLATVAFFPGP